MFKPKSGACVCGYICGCLSPKIRSNFKCPFTPVDNYPLFTVWPVLHFFPPIRSYPRLILYRWVCVRRPALVFIMHGVHVTFSSFSTLSPFLYTSPR